MPHARLATLAALVLVATPVAAQGHPLVGKWEIELQVGFVAKDGEAAPLMGKGTLTFTVQGDSIVGVMEITPGEGEPVRPPARLAARLVAGPITFVRTGTLTTTSNGETQSHALTNTYRFAVEGETLTGTVRRDVEGAQSAMGGTTPITGSRVKTF